MSAYTTSSFAAESGHWYTHDGQLVLSAKTRDGRDTKPTLRHARIHSWAPGVTTILRIAHREQLVQYRERQAAWAALTLPRVAGESDDEFIRRVMRDGGEAARQAADAGTSIHARIERAIRGEPVDDELTAAALATLPAATWVSEQAVVHPHGFATKADLHAADERIVVDIKTKDGPVETQSLYEDHYLQLAATAAAIGWEPGTYSAAILFVSRTETSTALAWADADELRHGWDVFRARLHLWQVTNRYRPTWATPVY